MPIAVNDWSEDLQDESDPRGSTSMGSTSRANRPSTSDFPDPKHFKVPNLPPTAYYIPDFITEQEEEYLLRKLEESPQPKWKTVSSGRRLQYWGGTMSQKGTLLPEPIPVFFTTFPDIMPRIEAILRSSALGLGGREGLDINQVLVNEYSPGQGISPHEDGPAFAPLVATLSLGSHCILDIHHYLSTLSPSPPMTATPAPPGEADSAEDSGRPIAAIPLAHMLILPRSLLILSSSLYTSHLHGIAARNVDTIKSAGPSPAAGEVVLDDENDGVMVANEALLGDAEIMDRLRETGRWVGERQTRTSLTFRHAERVVKGKAFALGLAGLRKV